MDEIRHTLPKKERLCGKTAISTLLAKGRHGKVPGLRYCFNPDSGAEDNRIMVSVPKKMFKRAVKRNLLKRRIRESWRRQKHNLDGLKGYDILFTYSLKEILSYEEIYEAVSKVVEKVRQNAEE
jgi:ribonuclease P protein component